MTEEQLILNEKIARLKGWRQDLDTSSYWVDPEGVWDFPGIPDWCNDKNLMHREKESLTDSQFQIFEIALKFVMHRSLFVQGRLLLGINLHMATAMEEAQALVLTLEGTVRP